MDREETLAIMSVLKAAYPSYYKGMTRREAEQVVRLWQELFRDDQAQAVALAVKRYIAQDSKGFPPHIGAIKQAVKDLPRAVGQYNERPGPEWAETLKKWDALRARRRAAGLPETACEARAMGMSAADYLAATEGELSALYGEQQGALRDGQ